VIEYMGTRLDGIKNLPFSLTWAWRVLNNSMTTWKKYYWHIHYFLWFICDIKSIASRVVLEGKRFSGRKRMLLMIHLLIWNSNLFLLFFIVFIVVFIVVQLLFLVSYLPGPFPATNGDMHPDPDHLLMYINGHFLNHMNRTYQILYFTDFHCLSGPHKKFTEIFSLFDDIYIWWWSTRDTCIQEKIDYLCHLMWKKT
ncbi:hypothetical protein ACJX0J_025574, partial [Zea mays]